MSTSPDPGWPPAAAVRRLTARELERFEAATPASAAGHRAAKAVLSGGVASSFQAASPWPIELLRGAGATVWDADGTERADFHSGFGAMVQGHANPVLVRAVSARCAQGTHFAAPGEDAAVVAAELARRWGLPRWRFVNSGSEAALDAVRIARAQTGRRTAIQAAGGYHGLALTALEGIVAVPFNDPQALEARIEELERAGRPPACVILEPALMLGCVEPLPGYLDSVREIGRRHGALVIFDEVKTGLSIAAGGATERYGVRPDLVALGKALGGGLPAGAVGGSEEAMAALEDGTIAQAGTFNGNALAMAAARASLLEILTPGAYERLERVGGRLAAGCERLFAACGAPLRALALGARGSLVLGDRPVVDEAGFLTRRRPDLERLLWLCGANRGLYLTPGRPQSWTISVAHDDAEIEAYVGVLAELVAQLGALA